MFEKVKKNFENESFYFWATILFLVIQGVIIAITSVNIPAGDEWESLKPGALPSGFSWDYIFSFLNEHRGIFTRLQNYVFFELTGWNMIYQILFNYIVFCGLVLFLIYFQKKYIKDATKGIWVLLFFLTSPLIVDNHNWAIQSFFHYCELFGVLAIFYATREKISTSDFWLAALFAAFSTYAFAAGMFFGLTVLIVLAYRLWREPGAEIASKCFKVLSMMMLVGSMGAWFIGYHKNPAHPEFVWPYSLDFWYFFSNLVSLGFGYRTPNILIAFIALALVVTVLLRSLKNAFSFKQAYVSFAFFASVAILMALGSIALSRTGFGLGQAKTSRYSELGILFVPFIGWLWWRLAQESEFYRKNFKYLIWFICLGFIGNYSYGTYFRVQEDRLGAVKCIEKYYKGENPTGECPVLYPGSIAEQLDIAKKIKLSWVPEK